jgi:glycolate oxidase
MVTPEGKVLRVGAKMVKSVAGYDLTRLMVGAQGVLGIVTSVMLKILPMPEERRVLAFVFPDGPRAAVAAAEIISKGFDPAALEIADESTMTAALGFLEGSLGVGRDAELLIEFHGTKSLCEGEASRVREMMESHFGLGATREARYPEAKRLWKARRAALAALASISPTVIVKDLTLPHGRMEGMVREIAEIARRHETRIAVFGHAGEGLLHAAVLSDGAGSDAAEKLGAAISELTGACVNSGGVVSGDRGIGLARVPAPAALVSEAGREVLRALKKSTDPKGIMNPGKLLHEG